MRIVDGRVIVCSPGRNFVTLKLVTEDGVYGLGDATLNGRELAVAAYLNEHVLPVLVGRDARRIEDIWQLLYKGAGVHDTTPERHVQEPAETCHNPGHISSHPCAGS